MTASQTADNRTCTISRSKQSCRKRQDASACYSLSRWEGVKCAGRQARGRVGEKAGGRVGGWAGGNSRACTQCVRHTDQPN